MKIVMKVCMVLAAFVVTTSVASAETVRVDYDYATTGIGTGSGSWSVTIDSGLIPGEAAGTPVTFGAPMATPAFVQVDTLFEVESNPGTAGLIGWANDDTDDGSGFNDGEGKGMYWKFYESTDTVTLTTTTAGFTDYTWKITTVLTFDADNDADFTNRYRWTADLFDIPGTADAYNGSRWRIASWWGDVDNAGPDGGHRHSGTKMDWGRSEDEHMWKVGDWWEDLDNDAQVDAGEIFATDQGNSVDHTDGLDEWSEDKSGFLDSGVLGDGIGFQLGFRNVGSADASVFISNVTLGGDVFADTGTIPEPATMLLLGLGGLVLRRKRRVS